MAKLNSFTCDICKQVRKEVNHWWVADRPTQGLIISLFDGEKENLARVVHLCGIDCATKWLAQQMQIMVGDQNAQSYYEKEKN